MIVKHAILNLSGVPQLSIMTLSISRFIPDRTTIDGLFVLNVISRLQTLQHLLACRQDVILRLRQIQTIMEYQVMSTPPPHVIIVIQEETAEEKLYFSI
jgi:hypothetical protein